MLQKEVNIKQLSIPSSSVSERILETIHFEVNFQQKQNNKLKKLECRFTVAGTYGTFRPNDTIGDNAVGSNAGVSSNQNILLHLTAVPKTDPWASVHIVSGVGVVLALLVGEVGLWGEGIDPAADHV